MGKRKFALVFNLLILVLVLAFVSAETAESEETTPDNDTDNAAVNAENNGNVEDNTVVNTENGAEIRKVSSEEIDETLIVRNEEGTAIKGIGTEFGCPVEMLCNFGTKKCECEAGKIMCDDGRCVSDEINCVRAMLVTLIDPLSVGDEQKVVVKSDKGENLAEVKVNVVSPSGVSLSSVTDADGKTNFKIKEAGKYRVVAVIPSATQEKSFRAYGVTASVITNITEIAPFFISTFGAETVESAIIVLVIAIALLAGVLAYKSSLLLFKEGLKTTSEMQKENSIRLGIAVVAFLLPTIAGFYADIAIGILVGLGENALMLGGRYLITKQKEILRRKAIHVEKVKESANPTEKTEGPEM